MFSNQKKRMYFYKRQIEIWYLELLILVGVGWGAKLLRVLTLCIWNVFVKRGRGRGNLGEEYYRYSSIDRNYFLSRKTNYCINVVQLQSQAQDTKSARKVHSWHLQTIRTINSLPEINSLLDRSLSWHGHLISNKRKYSKLSSVNIFWEFSRNI